MKYRNAWVGGISTLFDSYVELYNEETLPSAKSTWYRTLSVIVDTCWYADLLTEEQYHKLNDMMREVHFSHED